MKLTRKKYMLFALSFVGLFLLSGCTSPTDASGNIIMIFKDTPFMTTINDTGWFGVFVWPIAQIINYSADYVGAAGGIMAATVITNIVVVLLTIRSQIGMQRIQLIQPELLKIQNKYEGKTDDQSKMRMAQEMQALYGKYNINPLSSMLGTFVQFPIIFAIFQAVQRSPIVTNGTFLGMSLEQTPWNGITHGEWMYILLFVVMIAAQLGSMLVPQWLSKKKAKEKAAREHHRYVEQKNPMGNTMYFMMLPIIVLSVVWPSGMVVYFTISSLVNIVKTLVVQYIVDRKG